MRRLVTSLILSLFLLSGTGVAFADKHNDRDRDRKEYKHDNRRPGYGQGNHKRPGSGKDDKKDPASGMTIKNAPVSDKATIAPATTMEATATNVRVTDRMTVTTITARRQGPTITPRLPAAPPPLRSGAPSNTPQPCRNGSPCNKRLPRCSGMAGGL